MDAELQIRVKVMAREAEATLARLAKTTDMVGTAAGTTGLTGFNRFADGMGKINSKMLGGIKTMEKVGKNLQWTGRQLEFSFTLPLMIAGGMATKWALDNEKAMTQVRKVYGDGSESAKQLKAELDGLSESFRLLSDRFGVNQAAVINIGSEWAQAGSAGVGLAKSVKLTLEAMIVGNMDAEKATKGLIAVQSIYRLSSDDTRKALELMNSVENATATDMGDLITSFQAAGGTARTAGVDIRHLAAMTSALVPAAGGASEAGNALKTIISRIMAPTKQAITAMKSIGIEVDSTGWQSKNATERLEVLAKSFEGLTASQKSVTAAAISGRRQQSRYIQLMTEMADKNGFYARSLKVTNDQEKAHNTYQKELMAYLDSNPQKVKILTSMLQNFLASAIIPILPALIGFILQLTKMAKWFSNLSPQTQQFIMILLAMMAVIGPLARMIGAFTLLFSQLGHVVLWAGKGVQFMLKGLGLMGSAATKDAPATVGVFTKMWARITLASRKAWTAMAMNAQIASIRIRMAMQSAWSKIPGITRNAWAATSKIVSESAAMIALRARVAFAMVSQSARAAWASMTSSTVWVGMTKMAGSAFDSISLFAKMSWARVVTASTKGWEAVTRASAAAGRAATQTYSFMAKQAGVAFKAIRTQAIATQRAISGSAAWASITRASGNAFAYISMYAEVAWTKIVLTSMRAWLAMSKMSGIAGKAIGNSFAYISMYAEASWKKIAMVAGSGWTVVARVSTIAAQAAGRAYFFMAEQATAAFAVIRTQAIIAWAAISGAPLIAAIATVAAVVVALLLIFNKTFRDGVINFVKDVGNAIWAIPKAFGRMLVVLNDIVAKGVKNVMHWLSYLNPFAHHSPSMVENVTNGMNIIIDQYSRLGKIAPMLRSAAAAHNAFLAATAPLNANNAAAKRAAQRQNINDNAPAALPAFDNQVANIDALTSALAPLQAAMDAQQAVVDAWQASLDALSVKLRNAQYDLGALGDQVDALTKQITEHQSKIDDFMNVPIQGMNAMSDAIFANTMAQKKLQLQMMDMAKAGKSIDDIKSKMAALNGEIEGLNAEREGLRLAGGGSDVLGPLDAQLDVLKKQKVEMQEQGSALNDLQDQLDALKEAGDRLDLENSINFDPQLRQLDQLVNRMEEMPFDDIYASIIKEQKAIKAIQPTLDSIKKKYDAQNVVVQALQGQHDAVSHQLDLQTDQLKIIQDQYNAIKDMIDLMESALQSAVSNAQDLAAAAKDAADAIQDAVDASGDFQIPEATGVLGREGDQFDINKFNEEMQKEIDDMMKNMGTVDPFKGIKDKWHALQDDFKRGWKEFPDDFKRGLGVIGDHLSVFWGNFKNGLLAISDGVQNGLNSMKASIGTFFTNTYDNFTNGLQRIKDNVKSGVAGWWEDFNTGLDVIGATVTEHWDNFWTRFDSGLNRIGDTISSHWSTFWTNFDTGMSVIGDNIGTHWDNFWTRFDSGLNRIGDTISSHWEGFKTNFGNGLDVIGGWIGPKFTEYKNDFNIGLDVIGNSISSHWDGFKTNFGNGLSVIGDKLRDWRDKSVKPIMKDVANIFIGVFNNIITSVESFTNAFIMGFNAIARGIGAVSSFLGLGEGPGTIGHVNLDRYRVAPMMASGGQIPASEVGGGFVTDGARAIVGEGRQQHPEYVIPTDPEFRDRATRLWERLGNDLGMAEGGRVPQFASGGIFGDIVGSIGDFAGAAAGKARDLAATAMFAPVVTAANRIFDQIGSNFIGNIGHKLVNASYDWVKGDPISLAAGGRLNIPRTPGGVNLNVGEGRSGEQVQVLPYLDNGDGGGTTNNFYGSLSFPNITDPDDAEKFIKNLEGLTNG